MICGVRAAVASSLMVVAALGATPGADAHPAAGQVRHVIMFVGDGMQLEHEIAASRYLTGADAGLSFHTWPYQGNVATWDVNTYNAYGSTRIPSVVYDAMRFDPLVGYDPRLGGTQPYPLTATPSEQYLFTIIPPMTREPATDSASAATAYATGRKTDDGNLSWLPGDPPGGALPTIAERLRAERGFATGVVTTVPFSHATPAAFVAHNVSRNNYHQVADEMVYSTKPDVVIGGGHPLLRPDTGRYTYLSQQLYEHFASGSNQDYVFVERRAGADGAEALRAAAAHSAATGKRLFGLFGGPSGNMETPVPSDTPGGPTVRIGSTENPSLRDSTLAALDVVSRDRDGFFLMVEQGDIDWANHGNDYNGMIGTMWDLEQAVRAAVDFVDRPQDRVTWANTLLMVIADHGNSGMRLTGDPALGAGDLPAGPTACTPVCSYPDGEVTYRTREHTNELVRLYALGAGHRAFHRYEGSWYPGTSIIDNTQVHATLTGVLRLR